jgi:aspartate carbamoyltransferase catalytic subunit
VLYVTRVQKERFEDLAAYERSRGPTSSPPRRCSPPRTEDGADAPLSAGGRDFDRDVDSDPRAAYFRQMEYGLYVRMAMLAMVLGKA